MKDKMDCIIAINTDTSEYYETKKQVFGYFFNDVPMYKLDKKAKKCIYLIDSILSKENK